MRNTFFTAALCSALVSARLPIPDPCAAIAGKKWVSPLEARTCLFSAPLNEAVRANVSPFLILQRVASYFQTIEVINKTLAFHTSTNYQVQAPKPFDNDVHEDLTRDLARFSAAKYSSEFAFHLDIYRAFKRVNDGHCWVYNYCYDCSSNTLSSRLRVTPLQHFTSLIFQFLLYFLQTLMNRACRMSILLQKPTKLPRQNSEKRCCSGKVGSQGKVSNLTK